jgi:hypothetical protein
VGRCGATPAQARRDASLRRREGIPAIRQLETVIRMKQALTGVL